MSREVKPGQVYIAVRSRTGRRWEVGLHEPFGDMWVLYPIGDDVRPAQSHGRMNGGVRRIRRTTKDLLNRRRWRLV